MKKVLTLSLLLIHLCVFSQKKTQENKLRFQSINQIGFIYGETSTEPLLQSINGVRLKSFSAGIGVGLDYYKERSIPLFLDIRKYVFDKPISPFLYADGGYHIIWTKDQPEEWISKGYTGGIYYDLGAGYKFPAFKSSSVIISIGYSCKKMSEERNKYRWWLWEPESNDFEKLNYTLRRYSFKMGLAF